MPPFVPKRGRPRKPATRRLRSLYLSDAEYATLLTRVPPGRDFSDWARERLLSE